MRTDLVVRSLASAVAVCAAGCRSGRPTATPTPAGVSRQLLSSEGSEYAPVLRATVRVGLTADTVLVMLDSGGIRTPGVAGGAPPIMSALQLTPVLAVPRPVATLAGSSGAAPGGTAWTIIAEGTPAALADSLHAGESRTVPARRWALRRPPTLDPAIAFLVLRVTGEALEVFGRTPDGGFRVGASSRLRVRVYACARAALDGRLDAGRAAALAVAYTSAC